MQQPYRPVSQNWNGGTEYPRIRGEGVPENGSADNLGLRDPIRDLRPENWNTRERTTVPGVLSRNAEEVGHGHVTYVRKRIHAVSLWRFLY